MPFPFCRHDSLGKGGAFLSGMLLMAMAVARLTFSLSEGSKGAVVVYVRQLWFIWRYLLVRNFPVVMTCLYPLAHLSPLRLRNTISKLFNRAPTAVTKVLLIEQINLSANCFPKMSLIKIWCDVVTQCWYGTMKGSLLLFHCHIPTHKSDVTFCQHYSRQLSLFSPVLILCAVPVLKPRSCLS